MEKRADGAALYFGWATIHTDYTDENDLHGKDKKKSPFNRRSIYQVQLSEITTAKTHSNQIIEQTQAKVGDCSL